MTSGPLGPTNGRVAEASSCSNTPNAQTSLLESAREPLSCSGAIAYGVPAVRCVSVAPSPAERRCSARL